MDSPPGPKKLAAVENWSFAGRGSTKTNGTANGKSLMIYGKRCDGITRLRPGSNAVLHMSRIER